MPPFKRPDEQGSGLPDLFQTGLEPQEPMQGGEQFPPEAGAGVKPTVPGEMSTVKAPWDMAPEELTAAAKASATGAEKPDTSGKNPWEMTATEMGLAPEEDLSEASGAAGKPRYVPGARGQRPQFKLGDRSSVYGRAQRSDVGMEGVSAAARINAARAWGALDDPSQELEIARRAISRDLNVDYPIENVRIGPGTKALEWVNPKTGKWDLFAGAGSASGLKDLAAALPGLKELGYEVGGGIAGGVAGGVAGTPLGAPGVTGLAGNAAGTGYAAFYARTKRLEYAREQGMLPDLTDDDIFNNALQHGLKMGGLTLGAGIFLKGAAMIWKFVKGSPADLLDTYKHTTALAEGKPLADSMELRAQGVLGSSKDARFPVSSGQQGALPELFAEDASGVVKPLREGAVPRDRAVDEVLAAENAARRLRVPGGQGLDDVYAQQQKTTDAVDFATFGEKSTVAEREGGRAVQRAIEDATRAKELKLEGGIRNAELGKFSAQQQLESAGARTTEEAVTDMRSMIQTAKDNLFRPFKDAYDQIEGPSPATVDLTSFRQAARNLERTHGQTIIRSLNSVDIPAVQEAKTAGITETFVGNLIRRSNELQSVGKVETLRKDITEGIRQLENGVGASLRGPTAGAPRAQSVLMRLRDGLDDALERSMSPEEYQHILNVRRGFAEASDKFDRGVVGKIVEDEGFGSFKMSGNQTAEYLMADPKNAKAFVDAARGSRHLVLQGLGSRLETRAQPEMVNAVMRAQEGVYSHVRGMFKDANTGAWDTKGLARWLHDHGEAVQELFGVRRGGPGGGLLTTPTNRMTSIARNVINFQTQADALGDKLAKQSKLFSDRFGMFTGNPTQLARGLLDAGRLEDLNMASKLVKNVGGPVEWDKFKTGITSVARREVANPDGTLNLTKLSAFADSEALQGMEKVLGSRWGDNIRTLRDMMKIRELQASAVAPRDLAAAFTRGVPGLRGMSRFLRVIMPPMAPSGRGLTGMVGMINDKTQKRLGELMADPERLQQLINVAQRNVWLDPLTKAGKTQLAKLGLEHIPEYWQMAKKVWNITADGIIKAEERDNIKKENALDERAGWDQYKKMGQPQPQTPRPGGETPGFGQMPEPSKAGLKDAQGKDVPGLQQSDNPDYIAPGIERDRTPLTVDQEMEAAMDEATATNGQYEDNVERGYYNHAKKYGTPPRPAVRPPDTGPSKAGLEDLARGQVANDNSRPDLHNRMVASMQKQMKDAMRAGDVNLQNELMRLIKKYQGR